MTNTTIINAFHPDYMKTHQPNFWKEFKRNAENSAKTTEAVHKLRKERPSHGTVFGVTSKSVSLKPLEFLVYSRAGNPKKKVSK